MCIKCNDTGVVYEYKGMGITTIGPCMECDKPHENARRDEILIQGTTKNKIGEGK